MDEVEIVDLKPTELVDAIINGQVDAVLTWDPNAYNIKASLGKNDFIAFKKKILG